MGLVQRKVVGLAAILAVCALASNASAALLTIDHIIYQQAAGTTVDFTKISGTLDVTVSGSTLTIVMTNTSLDAAFVGGGAPATMLLTGFGLQLPGVNITGGTVTVTSGSTAVNFEADIESGPGVTPQDTTTISNQYIYANSVIDGYSLLGVPLVDSIVSSVNNGGGTVFAGPPPNSINGPDYGAISALETEFGGSQSAVRASITFVLNLDGTAPSFNTINAGNVVLAFGSPTLAGGPPGENPLPGVPEPTSLAVWCLGMVAAGFGARRMRRGK